MKNKEINEILPFATQQGKIPGLNEEKHASPTFIGSALEYF